MDERISLQSVKQTSTPSETVPPSADRWTVSFLERITDGFVAVDREMSSLRWFSLLTIG